VSEALRLFRASHGWLFQNFVRPKKRTSRSGTRMCRDERSRPSTPALAEQVRR
jgi:hypothetical protein